MKILYIIEIKLIFLCLIDSLKELCTEILVKSMLNSLKVSYAPDWHTVVM